MRERRGQSDSSSGRGQAHAPPHAPFDTRPLNAITIDVEDWLQSAVDPDLPVTVRFRASTRRVLDLLDRLGVRGTFFVLGLAAEKAPDLVRAIHGAGHEVQSHGYGHRLVHTQSPARFRADIERSKKLLEDLIGAEVFGYRAPAFSITRRTLWALDALADAGYRYDSSIFPIALRRYGISGGPRGPHRLRSRRGHELVEAPVATFQAAGRRVPAGGGGYFRLLPYGVLRRGVSQLNAQATPATIYMHPYEFDPDEVLEVGFGVPWSVRARQGIGRRGFAGKVARLLRDYRFGALSDMLAAVGALPAFQHAADVV